MSQVGRSVKNLEAPRPLKSQSRSNIVKSNYIVIEELIQLIENVAATLASGISNQEAMLLLVQNLRLHGPQMESVSKDTLDRAFVTFRNASQDERLNIMTRLNLLELIELRAKSWKDDGANIYYKAKATNVEPDNITGSIIDQSSIISTSPQSLVTSSAAVNLTAGGGQHHQQQQQQHNQMNQTGATLLGPGEVIRNSGKFSKPTKIPGKNYSKDEVVIRNADSGKVMGIKGRRVHMIEELSETIISFQRVNAGAKERLVQITGPTEEKINYAKQLIEDTIRRNASPVRLEPISNQSTGNEGGAGSCSSLASSNSDEVNMRSGITGHHHLNRNSIGAVISNVNYVQPALNSVVMSNMIGTGNIVTQSGINKRSSNASVGNNSGQQPLLHSFSTNDATLGEYKYTVNVGHHIIKITGDNCELVRAAKLVLDDYFSSNEFLASVEAGAAFDNVMINSTSTPTTPLTGGPAFAPQSHQLISSTPFADSGIGLNYMAGQISGNSYVEGDDDVFIIEENGTPTPVNGLSRSRRSHFSRKDSTPPDNAKLKTTEAKKEEDNVRIVHEYERLIYYAKSPHSWALPRDWQKIIDKHPSLIRNKVNNIAGITMITTTSTTPNSPNSITTAINVNTTTSATSTAPTSLNNINNSTITNFKTEDTLSTLPHFPSIKRKGFFNRYTFSIDESEYLNENSNNINSMKINDNTIKNKENDINDEKIMIDTIIENDDKNEENDGIIIDNLIINDTKSNDINLITEANKNNIANNAITITNKRIPKLNQAMRSNSTCD